jgi:hypothetical protein
MLGAELPQLGTTAAVIETFQAMLVRLQRSEFTLQKFDRRIGFIVSHDRLPLATEHDNENRVPY